MSNLIREIENIVMSVMFTTIAVAALHIVYANAWSIAKFFGG